MELTEATYSLRSPYDTQTTTTPREEQDNDDIDSDVEIAVVRPLRASPVRKSRPPSAIVLVKRESFAKSLRAISENTPPIKDPIGYSSSVLGLCCTIPAGAGCGIFCCLLIIILLNFVPISMILVGAEYFDRETYCPAENISILFIVGGSICLVQGVAESIVRFIGVWKLRKGDPSDTTTVNHPAIQIMNLILRLASFGWFIAACVIVYRIYPDVKFNEEDGNSFCHPVLYGFAFWLCTMTLIFIILSGALLCISCCCVLCIKK